MHARIFRAALKPGCGDGYARAIENDVIPILRKFAGFLDEIAMVSAGGTEAIGISFWDSQEHADAYDRAAYPDVGKALAPFLQGAPALDRYQVTNIHGPLGRSPSVNSPGGGG